MVVIRPTVSGPDAKVCRLDGRFRHCCAPSGCVSLKVVILVRLRCIGCLASADDRDRNGAADAC